MPKTISNEQIYTKLLQIEKTLKSKLGKRSFTNITEWKKYIWDSCPHKKEKVEDNEISFWCDILKSSCEFEDCPRNVID